MIKIRRGKNGPARVFKEPDWSLSNRELARQHGTSSNFWFEQRIKLGLPPSKATSGGSHLPPGFRSQASYRWDTVDWSKTRRQIALEMGCTIGRVYQVAQERGKQRGRK